MSNHQSRNCLWTIALIAIIGSIVASAVLVGEKIGIIPTLPGCGPDSGCAKVTSGPWGTIPGLAWPVSFVGLAWFTGMLVSWIRSKNQPSSLIWFIRLGMLGSVGFVIIMISTGSFCPWCTATHVCNLVFWIAAEMVHRHTRTMDLDTRKGPSTFVLGCGSFVIITVVLAILMTAATERKKTRLADNTAEIIAGTDDSSTSTLLEGRHRKGPADAAVQVVMFTDYQCPDCRRLEAQMDRILQQRNDVSLSIKHFPFCTDCNKYAGRTMHPNACWAARASEAAAILGGEEGFWRMHRWLFDNKGQFTDASFPTSLRALGFDPDRFKRVMTSANTADIIRPDMDDAKALGIWFTPMIFINGVEYTWYLGSDASLAATIEKVAASTDRRVLVPPDAEGKLIADWRSQPMEAIPDNEASSWLGDGSVDVVVIGDYQTVPSKKLDVAVRELIDEGADIRYTWRHFPVDGDCNATVSKYPKQYIGSCLMAQAVEAVGRVGNEEARWRLHAWLIENAQTVSANMLAEKASELGGVDAASVLSTMDNPSVRARVQQDISLKNRVWRRSVPILLIAGKHAPRWSSTDVEAKDIIRQMVEEAAE
jgi:protein-disulfide isomerase/uncharacterized membrane protein